MQDLCRGSSLSVMQKYSDMFCVKYVGIGGLPL